MQRTQLLPRNNKLKRADPTVILLTYVSPQLNSNIVMHAGTRITKLLRNWKKFLDGFNSRRKDKDALFDHPLAAQVAKFYQTEMLAAVPVLPTIVATRTLLMLMLINQWIREVITILLCP